MKIVIKLINISILTLCLVFTAFAQTSWVGEYFFAEDGGETEGGSKIYIAHSIKVTKKDGKLAAHIYSQGFQTSRDIYADVKVVDEKIEFYFREKGEDQYTSTYNKGDLLLTFEKKEVDGEINLLTNWLIFKPKLDANNESGKVYFEEVKANEKSADQQKWIKLESKSKEVSVSFPSDSIINAEDKNRFYRYQVFGFSKGISMYLNVYRKNYSVKNLKMMRVENLRGLREFQVDQFTIRTFTGDPSDDKVHQTLFIASKDKFYYLSVSADSADNENIFKFLMSININGKPLFEKIPTGKILTMPSVEKTIAFSDLKSSPEVIEAYERKSIKKKDREIKSEIVLANKVKEKRKIFDRNLIIVDSPSPKFPSKLRRSRGRTSIRIRVEFLANGQIGDITILDSPTEKIAKQCCVDVITNIKFIPAQINGKNVDSTRVLSYSFSGYR